MVGVHVEDMTPFPINRVVGQDTKSHDQDSLVPSSMGSRFS